MTQTDKWSEYWNNQGTSGEVFVNKAGDRHPRLASYWQTQLSGAPAASNIIDLACGAGSVFSDLGDNHSYTLIGTDLSVDALKLMHGRLPSAHVVSCSLSQLPFRHNSFDLVVSQFGIEYAGVESFADAGNLVASGGRIAILCHIEDGYINIRNAAMLAGAQEIIETGFVERSIELVKAAFTGKDELILKAEAEFNPAHGRVSAILEQNPEGIHNHLYFGFKKLYERRAHYDVSDITNWLESMRVDVQKNILRLTETGEAACSEAEIKQVCRDFTKLGLRKVGYSPFLISGNDLPIAWSITAERS